jgi:ABC-2 type transport system ATP-binding protein
MSPAPAQPVADPAELRELARELAELPPPAAVWCSGLRKRYGRQTAVQDVSLEVGPGEVVGLLGPNGAGKTSVIKMLLGLVRPDAGEVLLLGQPAADPAARSKVGYLPELFRYQPWLSPLEVLDLHVRLSGSRRAPARAAGGPRAGRARRARRRPARRLLQGHAAAARARRGAGRPAELIVLDEPTSALDPLGRVDVRDVVLSLKERGVAVLLNSHLIGEVERVCDRVVILDRGRVAASGSLVELLGQRELRLQLTGLSPPRTGGSRRPARPSSEGDWVTVALPVDDLGTAVPGLVADLVALGVQVHAVEPGRITLEERLLGILRDGADARAEAQR